MDIEVEKLISACNGTLVVLSDEMILAIGKRYFELASGKKPIREPEEKTVEASDVLKAADALEAAYIIKEYCKKRMCPGCPFSYQTVSSDFVCKCCLRDDDEASITPEKWQLPPKEV